VERLAVVAPAVGREEFVPAGVELAAIGPCAAYKLMEQPIAVTQMNMVLILLM
jgi:hypothetical protein